MSATEGSERPFAAPPDAGPRAADAVLPPALLAWARTAPVGLAALADDDRLAWCNDAFAALLGVAADDAVGRPWQDVLGDPAPLAAGRAERRLLARRDGAVLACDVQCDPAAPGVRLLTLVDRRAEHAARERLDFVQTHARIGLWERDVRTLEGRWDEHMFRFFGLDPARGTPSIAHIASSTIPDDRLGESLTESMRTPGTYSTRYRMLAADGTLRRIRSQWDVIAGPDGGPARVVGLVMDDTEAFALGASAEEQVAQFRLATELADVSIWRHDLRTDRMHFNERAFGILGQQPRPEGMAIEEFRRLIHPDDLPEVAATIERALASGTSEDMQARYRHADGRWRHVFTRRLTQRDAHGTPVAFVGVALDVTAQVERLQRADEVARHLDAVTAASGIGVWRLRRDGGPVEWNPQMRALSGLPDDQPPPHFDAWVDQCVHPEDRERVRAMGRAWLREPGPPAEIAHRIVMPDGEVRHIVARGHVEPKHGPYRLTGVSIDVTERERALAALRQATERSAIATQAAGIGIWEWDAETQTQRWDDEMFRLYGFRRERGATGLEFEQALASIHPDDRRFVSDQVYGARVGNRPAYYEFRIVRPDGAVRWLASRSMPLGEPRESPRSRLGVNWDVTEVRDAAAARQARALALRESQAKSALLARMSHELRTPLNAVLGFTQLLIEDEQFARGGDPAVRLDRLERVRASGNHLLGLIDDVLEVSRLDGPDPDMALQRVALADVVAQAAAQVEPLARQRAVALTTPTSPLHVRADAPRLVQVLASLLTNAVQYNRPGGSVRLEAAPDAGRVFIRVADDGVGMTPAQQELAFEPFSRVGAPHDERAGVGIGLTLVKALVERMGGRVSMRSTPGVGSVFEVCLDAAPDLDGGDGDGAPAAARRLLYIEDNEVNVMIVRELVRRRGDVDFDSAPDGASGVARAAQWRPALTLVDMHLPDIDGLEVLQRLRAEPLNEGMRIVALSANAIPADIRRALDAGFDDYWTKPLDFAVFTKALDVVYPPAAR